MEERELTDAIRQDNNRKKENCLQHLMYMCYESGVKIIDIKPEYGPDCALNSVVIQYLGGKERRVKFPGKTALEMVAAIITKGRLGKRNE